MSKSPYTNKHAAAVRWALEFAQSDTSKFFSETRLHLVDSIYSLVSSHEAPPPIVRIREYFFRGLLGAPDREILNGIALHFYIKDIAADFRRMLAPLIELAKGSSAITFPLELFAHFGSSYYEASAVGATVPFRESDYYVAPGQFPGDIVRQLMRTVLVAHLAKSSLSPVDFRKCGRCPRVLIPTRSNQKSCEPVLLSKTVQRGIKVRLHSCAYIHGQRNRKPRTQNIKFLPRADWIRFESFLADAGRECRRPTEMPRSISSASKRTKVYPCGFKGCFERLGTETDRYKHWEWSHENPENRAVREFVERRLKGGWRTIARWSALSSRGAQASEIWEDLAEEPKRTFRENWPKLGQV
jgi:hypothetical protein